MSNSNFNSTNSTLRQLLGNGVLYKVPRFQRDYSWTEEEWDDLWQDIIGLSNDQGEDSHYMGYLVLQTKDNKEFNIIDGQQRITTLSLLVLAILSILEEIISEGIDIDDNTKRVKTLRDTYIGSLDVVTLVPEPKLKLNRNNNDFYQTYLIPNVELPKRNLKNSDKLLKNSFLWFKERLNGYIINKSGGDFAKFIEKVSHNLFFTVITVNDELNAYKVFETLNSRGVRLSATDLLKNLIFSIISKSGSHETEMDNLEQHWERILGKLGNNNFSDFVRVFWNSRFKLVRKNELFKTIKQQIETKEQAFELIRSLDKNADVYVALKNPFDELWNREQKTFINELKMFSITQPYSTLLSAYSNFNEADFTKLLQAISIVSFRYNLIGGLNPNTQEGVYNKLANDIYKKTIDNFGDAKEYLKQIYPSDDRFKTSFTEKEIKATSTNKKTLILYILSKLEYYNSNNVFDVESEKYTLEHILPCNPDESWEEYDEQTDKYFISRIGNYTILERNLNKDAGNSSFDIKINLYKKSKIYLSSSIPEYYNNWNSANIIKRQEWLANQATKIWEINFK